jgi:predicted MPP superfamily phosphohydrolase
METKLERKIELFTIENFNKGTKLIFEKLYEISKLKDGETIEGSIKHADLKLSLYSEFYNYKPIQSQDWGEIAIQDIINFTDIEILYKYITEHLKSLSLVGNNFIYNQYLEFKKKGYIDFSLLKAQGENPNYFKTTEPKTIEEKVDVEEEKVELTILEDDELEKIILQKVYEYESTYNKPIFFYELAFRVINFLNPGIERFDSIYDIDRSKEYRNFTEVEGLLKNTVLKLYRRDLLYYDVRFTSSINLTNRGRTFLSEGIIVIKEEEKIPSLKTIKLLHITDLHFGSLEDAGVDNKDKMEDTSGIKQANAQSFLNAVRTEINQETFLIVSGDLTSKHEDAGFVEAKAFLGSIGIRNENTYLVPGNHDYSMQENEATAFASFKHYFDDFHNPLHMNKYIINPDLKLFIYGFKSVHIHKVEEELREVIYVHTNELQNLESLHEKLTGKYPDFDTYLKVAVVHHNMTDHPSIEFKKYGEAVNAFNFKHTLMKLGFTAVFSGHKHDPLVERQELFIQDFTGKLLFVSGGSLFGVTIGRPNSFQIVNINTDINTNQVHSIEVDHFEKNPMGAF